MSQPPPSQPSLEREMSNEEITGKPWSIDLQTMKKAPREGEPITQPIASGDKGDLLDVLLTAKKWRFENMDKENWLVTVTYDSSLRFSEKIDKDRKILKGNFAYYASKKVQEDVDFMNLSLSEIDDLLDYLETLNPSDIEDLSNLIIMIIDKYAECSDDKKLEIESKIDAALRSATGRAESSASALPGPPPARAESSALALPGPPPARAESSASALPAPPPASIEMDLGSQPPTTVEDKTAIVSAIVKIYNVIDNTHDIQLVSNAIALLVIIKEDIQSRGIGIEQVNTAFINLIDDIIGNFAKLKADIKTLQHSARSLYIKLRLFAARYDIYDLPVRLQMSINSLAGGDMDKELIENMDVCQAYVMDGGFSNQLFETYQRRPYGITVNGVATVDGISPVGDPKRTILMNSCIIKNSNGTYTSGIKYAFQGKGSNKTITTVNYDYMQLPQTIQIFGVVHVFADYRQRADPKAAGTIVVYTVEEAYFKSNISYTRLEIESYRQARVRFAHFHKFDEEFFGLDVVTINGTKYCIIGASVGSVPVDFVGQQCAIASDSSADYTTRCAAGELTEARIVQLRQDTLFIPYEISKRLNLLVLNTVKTVGDAAKPYAAQYAADFFNDVFFNDLSKNSGLKNTLSSIGFEFTTDGKMKVAVFTGDGFMQTFDTKDVMIWFGMKPNLTVYGVADAASVPIERNNRVIDFGFDKIEKLVKIAAFGLRNTSKLDTKNPPHLYTEAGLDKSKGTPMIWNKYSKLHNYALKNLNIPILVRNSFEGTNMQTYRSAQTHPIKQLLSIEKMVGIFRQGQIEQVSSDITERLMKNLITNTPETSEGYMQQYNITALVMLLDNFCNAFQIDPLSMLPSKKRERRTSPVQNSYWFIDWLEQRIQSVFINQYQPYCQKDLRGGLNAVIVSVEQIKPLLPLPLPPLQLPPPPPPLNAQNNAKRRKITVKSTKGRSASSGLSAKQKKQGRSASSGLKDASMSISPKQYTRKINQGKSASLDFSRETMSSEAKRRTKKASPGQATSMSISSPKPNPPWKLGGFIEKK